MALRCLSAVVKHGILTKSITNSKSEEAKGIRIPTLPEVLQLCMQSDNWEVKDSCIELVGEVYQCCVQPGKLNPMVEQSYNPPSIIVEYTQCSRMSLLVQTQAAKACSGKQRVTSPCMACSTMNFINDLRQCS